MCMKMCGKVTLLIAGVASCLFFISAPQSARGATLVVGQNTATCPTAKYSKIQDAVTAAVSGDTIHVCAGTYAEQVSIDKTLHITGDNGAIIKPSPVTANATSLTSGQAVAAIVLVESATGVVIQNVTVDGTNNGISECSPDLVGVFYRNASGELNHVAVRNVKLTSSLDGCQSGSAVFVQSGGGTSVVTIANSSIHDYQKNGITANEAGTQVSISGNVVTGLGPTMGAAQNGIQIGFGASGTIHQNTVANHIWSPCTSIMSCANTAVDILVFQSNGVTVDHNQAGVSQTGIAIAADSANVLDNTVSDSLIFDGVLLQGNGNIATGNHITHSDQAGVVVSGNSNTVQTNVINEAAVGVSKITGSTGNSISGNTFFNTPVQVQDPSVRALRQPLPYR